MDGIVIIILLSFLSALYAVLIYKLSVIEIDVHKIRDDYYELMKDFSETNGRILGEWKETLESHDRTLKLLKEAAELLRKDAENAKGKD